MFLNISFIIAGIVLVLWGADRLTEGAVTVAERLKVPQIVIGLTIVAIGTSMPEFCVSLVSAVKGTSDLAVGNIVGSNIFNTLVIVGAAAMVAPITILHTAVRKDIPFAMMASALLMMLCYDGNLSRVDAAVLLVMFAAFMYITLTGAKQEAPTTVGAVQTETTQAAIEKPKSKLHALFHPQSPLILIPLGLVCLIVGSNIFVEGATYVAGSFGVSEAVIGLTIVAMGTSLPELATSVVAAHKGNSGIAIGNVLGSNVFNILLVLGATGAICPMQMEGIGMTDFSVMVLSMILLWLFSFTKYTIQRWEGTALLVVFVGYYIIRLA